MIHFIQVKHVEQVKGDTDIRKCEEADRTKIVKYLKEEPVYHTFLLSDLECYGFDQEFQQVYIQEEKEACEGVVLRYYNNLILSEFSSAPKCEEIAQLVTSGITTVMGKSEIVEQVMEHVEKTVKITCNTLYVHQHMKELPKKEGTIRKAEKKDIDRIYEFLMAFPETRSLYAEKGMIENRICGTEGFHIIMEKDGAIIAHGNSAAATDQTCMIGGICVAESMRGKGCAKEILHTLCEEIRRQGKIPCIFASEKEQYSIFEELGFEKYGRWGVAKV